MKIHKKSRTKDIRGKLLVCGLNFREFAEMYGHNYQTVRETVRYHWGKDTNPRGEKTLAVLNDLNKVLEKAA